MRTIIVNVLLATAAAVLSGCVTLPYYGGPVVYQPEPPRHVTHKHRHHHDKSRDRRRRAEPVRDVPAQPVAPVFKPISHGGSGGSGGGGW